LNPNSNRTLALTDLRHRQWLSSGCGLLTLPRAVPGAAFFYGVELYVEDDRGDAARHAARTRYLMETAQVHFMLGAQQRTESNVMRSPAVGCAQKVAQ
jgi:hypothetical protein